MKKKLFNILLLLSLTLSACSVATPTPSVEDSASAETTEIVSAENTESTEEADEEISRPSNWAEETHSNDAEPNYEVVFPEDKVNKITITISPENWEAMQADMVALLGEQGSDTGQMGDSPAGRQPQKGERPQAGEDFGPPADGEIPESGDFQPPEGFGPPAEGEMPEDFAPPAEGERPAMPGGGGGDMTSENPTWVEATIEFEGNTWANVGVRYKGNSSLTSSWRNGTDKLPFKLDFDEFEDEHPEIDDQRFYGFKQLSLSSNFNDNSLLREKVAADIFRESGVPAAQTAFYEIYLDYGEGSTYLGLYTMVEVVDDTLIEAQFDDDSGNVYKPEGTGASFAANSFSENSFDKESNQDEADYSDILALYDVLHSETRLSNPESWRAELESVFDTDGFLHYLAVNNTIQNWDTYGRMTHNYYLYNNPETGLLTWIPWDNNEALGSGKRQGTLSLSMDEVGTDWPLIRYLMDDPVYNEIYTNYLAETVVGAFNPDKMAATYQEMATLIAPYASADVGEAAFNSAVQELINHAYQRAEAVNTFLGK